MATQRIRVGCCGFPCAKARYYQEFEVVELQQTFYAMPRPGLLAKWRCEAPEWFEFVIKASQFITHPATSPTYRRAGLKVEDPAAYGGFKPTPQVWRAWTSVVAQAEILRARVVLFQTPSSFGPTPENMRNLTRFFERIDRKGLILAWESRGRWPEGLLRELCSDLELVDCVDPFLRQPTTEGLFYFRLHGGKGYRKRYSEEELNWLKGLCTGRSGYLMFNNIHMLEDARRMEELLA